MKLSARNVIKGKVTDVKEGQVVAKVKVDIGSRNAISSLIGDEINVLIKATSVMLAK